MIVSLIRHGKTQGNIEKRYIGKTDEPLADIGIDELKKHSYPDCEIVYTSPMLRCTQTAAIIYPDKEKVIIDSFRECDFGVFEGHNYNELSGNPLYQQWIDSYGTMDFPEGERIEDFKERTVNAFDELIARTEKKNIAIVAHGGTIMTLLWYFEEKHDYYAWQTGNGCGFVCDYNDGIIKVTGKIE